MKPRELGMLILLAAIWGASYLFIRVASPVLGPLLLMELRTLIGGLGLLAYALLIGQPPDLRAHWQRYLVLGTLGSALPFTLIAASELAISASLAAILNATTPLFTAVVASVWADETFTAKRAVGLALGFAGVTILMGWSPVPLTGAVLLGTLGLLLASLSYGVGGAYASRAFHGVPPLTMAIGQQFGAAAVLLPFSLVSLPRAHLTGEALANLLALALLSTSLGYLIYYPLFKSVGPTRTLSVTFLIPVFGLLWDALFLHERIGPGTLIGTLVILSSITLVTGLRLWPPRRA
jgi:drug/metabolite transporter (DMT)-like permease